MLKLGSDKRPDKGPQAGPSQEALFSFFAKKEMIKIHSIETFGTHEGPGIRLVVFVQGCNFRCAYCHNPDTIGCRGGLTVSVKEIISMLEDQRPYFANGGGLTVSGGEPLLQAKELIPLFREARRKGFHTALDTNASIDTPEAKKLMGLSDLAIIDLKHFDDHHHRSLTGQGNKNVFRMIQYREDLGQPFWIRHVLVPGWTDQDGSLKRMAEYLKSFKQLERFEILPYHNLGEYKYKEMGEKYRLQGKKPPDQETIRQVEEILKNQKAPVFIRR
jgi:pyruvate formate lyase activating enzyme